MVVFTRFSSWRRPFSSVPPSFTSCMMCVPLAVSFSGWNGGAGFESMDFPVYWFASWLSVAWSSCHVWWQVCLPCDRPLVPGWQREVCHPGGDQACRSGEPEAASDVADALCAVDAIGWGPWGWPCCQGLVLLSDCMPSWLECRGVYPLRHCCSSRGQATRTSDLRYLQLKV